MALRLLADEMLAKLVRFLRVFGIPVRHVEKKSDEQILGLAKRAGYLLLTSDEELSRRAKKRQIPVLYLPQTSIERQVAQVVRSLKLQLPSFPAFSLCPRCGGKLVKAKKGSLRGKVYPSVLRRRRLFWRCSSCSHIYWSGTHYAKLKRTHDKILRLISG